MCVFFAGEVGGGGFEGQTLIKSRGNQGSRTVLIFLIKPLQSFMEQNRTLPCIRDEDSLKTPL